MGTSSPGAVALTQDLAMEDGGPRIRRRVSVRKRDRGSLESVCAAPTPAEPQFAQDPEDEEAAGSRRRKTGSPEPAQENDSEEDMFSGYDSFTENSFLAHVDDLEQKYMQVPEDRTLVAGSATKDLSSDKNRLVDAVSNFTHSEANTLRKSQSGPDDPAGLEPENDVLFDVPSSQILYFENLQNSLHDLDHQPTIERDRTSCESSNQILACSRKEQPPQSDAISKARSSPEMSKRKSLTDHLKSTMTGNAMVQTPVFSRSKQLRETLLSEEINVAKKAIESPSDDLGPFYFLPSKVRDLYVQLKGITKLYGNTFYKNENQIYDSNYNNSDQGSRRFLVQLF